MSRVLIFTVATNNYYKVYRRCIESQRKFANKHNYNYLVIKKLPIEAYPDESAWLKIYIIKKAIEGCYDKVLFIDSDCEIRPHTPSLENFGSPVDDFFIAKGISGRVNSGVMLIVSTTESKKLINSIIKAADNNDIIQEDEIVGWENGHVIHFTKKYQNLKLLDWVEWNNSICLNNNSFIQHYSGAKLRSIYLRRYAKLFYLKSVVYPRLFKLKRNKIGQSYKDQSKRTIAEFFMLVDSYVDNLLADT